MPAQTQAKNPEEMSKVEMLALLEKYREDKDKAEQELAKEREDQAAKISFKVSEKGGVSLYGLGRFPVTLYLSQWRRLIAVIPRLVAFLDAHEGELATKDNGKPNGS